MFSFLSTHCLAASFVTLCYNFPFGAVGGMCYLEDNCTQNRHLGR